MKNVKVIDLAATRELLVELDKARSAILSGHTAGFYAGRLSTAGDEQVFLGGVYLENPGAAVRALLKAAATHARACRAADESFMHSMM